MNKNIHDDRKKSLNKKIYSQNEKYYQNKLVDFTYLHNYGYKIYKELGRGGYGVVYKAYKLRSNGSIDKSKKFAIKINFLTVTPELIYSEIGFLTLVKDKPNLPQLQDLFIEQNKVHIVLDFFKYKPFIAFFSEFTLLDIKYYLYELLKSLNVIHQLGIYHRDVKPGNFLYDPDKRKGILIDFGLSEIDINHHQKIQKEQKENMLKNNNEKVEELEQLNQIYSNILKCQEIVGNNKIGTEPFMPLESILRYSRQTYAVDVWPVGVIFLQFLLRKYNIFNHVRMINKPPEIKNNFYITFILELVNIFGTNQLSKQCERYGYKTVFPKDLPQDSINFMEIIKIEGFDGVAEDLLKRMLQIDFAQRISVEQALSHSFFDEIKQKQENIN